MDKIEWYITRRRWDILQENNKIQIFDNQPIRTAWDEENEEWYFSIVDVVAVLTDSKDANAYWRKLKQRLIEDGNETVTNCHGLKMKAADGKRRMTDVANTEQLLRIIQSIPSKKAEPFKVWLAQGRERIEEIIDPELTIDRALETYSKKGYPADWINQRLQTIRARKELTNEWQNHGVKKGAEYAILTDEVTKAWSGMNTRQYKNLKGLKKENLRDNMSTLELALNMLAEATTTELTRSRNPQGLEENRTVARTGGRIAGEARERIESETGNPVITSENAVSLNSIVTGMIEGILEAEENSEE
ncbi:MAG: BRO family protein [Eubacterium sp.]